MAATAEYSEAYLHQNKQSQVIGVLTFYIVLEVLTLAVRQFSKYLGRVRWGWDDALMILGFCLCMAEHGTSLADVYNGGIGLHEALLEQEDPHKIIVWGHYIVIVPLLYVQAIVPAKLAVLHLYLSIFTDKRLRIGTYITGGIIIGTWVAWKICGLNTCHPISYFWTGKGNCFNVNAYFRFSGLPNILTDIAILALPLPMVYHLQTSRRMKVGIAATFALGGVGLIASILRFYFFFVSNAEVDGTWNASSFIMWCAVECGTYQVAACFPLYRPLVKFLASKLHLTSKGDGPMSSGASNPVDSFRTTSRGPDDLKYGGRFHSVKRNKLSLDEEDGLGLVTIDRRSQLSQSATSGPRELTEPQF